MGGSEYVVYFLIYILLCVCIVFPPTEFISAGLTVDSLLYKLYGDEHIDFVLHHIKRTCYTTFIHSCLPLGYFLILEWMEDDIQVFDPTFNVPLWIQIGLGASVLLAIGVGTLMYYRSMNDWAAHPTVRSLTLYSVNWRDVANTINLAYRSVDKFSVSLGGIRQVIVTESWILLVSSYGLELSQQADVKLTAIGSDQHAISHHGDATVQFINVLVENTDKPIKPFVIRLQSVHYRDLVGRLQTPIDQARDVIIHQDLSELFVDAFKQQALENPSAPMTQQVIESLEMCLGCSQFRADVKLDKNCVDQANAIDEDGRPLHNCSQCYCRPMWCVSCMARWFASRQDVHRPDTWMKAKCPCPTCRTLFCTLDVCVVSNEQSTQ